MSVDLHRYITLADACRRLAMRDTDGRAWLRARGLVRRLVVGGRVRLRVLLAELVAAMEAPTAPPPPPLRRKALAPAPSWDDLLRR